MGVICIIRCLAIFMSKVSSFHDQVCKKNQGFEHHRFQAWLCPHTDLWGFDFRGLNNKSTKDTKGHVYSNPLYRTTDMLEKPFIKVTLYLLPHIDIVSINNSSSNSPSWESERVRVWESGGWQRGKNTDIRPMMSGCPLVEQSRTSQTLWRMC
jgi:hypothetical protein